MEAFVFFLAVADMLMAKLVNCLNPVSNIRTDSYPDVHEQNRIELNCLELNSAPAP